MVSAILIYPATPHEARALQLKGVARPPSPCLLRPRAGAHKSYACQALGYFLPFFVVTFTAAFLAAGFFVILADGLAFTFFPIKLTPSPVVVKYLASPEGN